MSKHDERIMIPINEQLTLVILPLELSDRLGELRYDGLADYLAALAEKLWKDSVSDGGRGRGQLAGHLGRAAAQLRVAVEEIEDAWDICRPYMKED